MEMPESDPWSGLSAGSARADITPALGTQLAGDIGRHRPVEEICDRLYANVLVAEAGEHRVCVLSLDLLGVTQRWADEIRQRAAREHGLRTQDIMIHAVQNHAAPCVGHFFVDDASTLIPDEYRWLRGGDDDYHGRAVDLCVKAIGEAASRVEPVTLQVGRGVEGRIAFNRRCVMRDGTVVCHPRPGDPGILHAEGPVDPEVGVLTLTNARGEVIGALLHFTCHPCHGYPHRFVIGDWPGEWGRLARERFGERCVPLVINGCCGNIHHSNPLDAIASSAGELLRDAFSSGPS